MDVWNTIKKPVDWVYEKLGGGPEYAPAQAPQGAPSQCAVPAEKTDPTKRSTTARKMYKSAEKKPQFGEMMGPAPITPEAPKSPEEPKKDDKGKMTGKDWAGVGLGGASVLGGILAALGEGDPDARAYDLPGASGPDALALGGVDKPFTGRMDMTPEQRQSLALAMLR